MFRPGLVGALVALLLEIGCGPQSSMSPRSEPGARGGTDLCKPLWAALRGRATILEQAEVLAGGLKGCAAARPRLLRALRLVAKGASKDGNLERLVLARRALVRLDASPGSRAALAAALGLMRSPKLSGAGASPQSRAAWQALLEGRYAEAARAFRGAVRKAMRVHDVVGLARALRSQGKVKQASHWLARALGTLESHVGDRVKVKQALGHSDWVYSVAISPDGRVYASGGRDQVVKVWDTASGRLLYTLPYKKTRHGWKRWGFPSLAFSPDGKLLAGANADSPDTPIWDLRTGKLVRVLRPTNKLTMTRLVVISRDGRRLATSYYEGHVLVWDLKGGKQLHVIPPSKGSTPSRIGLGAHGSLLATTVDSERIEIWRLDKHPRRVRILKLDEDVAVEAGPWFDATGRRLAIRSGGRLLVYDLRNGRAKTVGLAAAAKDPGLKHLQFVPSSFYKYKDRTRLPRAG